MLAAELEEAEGDLARAERRRADAQQPTPRASVDGEALTPRPQRGASAAAPALHADADGARTPVFGTPLGGATLLAARPSDADLELLMRDTDPVPRTRRVLLHT